MKRWSIGAAVLLLLAVALVHSAMNSTELLAGGCTRTAVIPPRPHADLELKPSGVQDGLRRYRWSDIEAGELNSAATGPPRSDSLRVAVDEAVYTFRLKQFLALINQAGTDEVVLRLGSAQKTTYRVRLKDRVQGYLKDGEIFSLKVHPNGIALYKPLDKVPRSPGCKTDYSRPPDLEALIPASFDDDFGLTLAIGEGKRFVDTYEEAKRVSELLGGSLEPYRPTRVERELTVCTANDFSFEQWATTTQFLEGGYRTPGNMMEHVNQLYDLERLERVLHDHRRVPGIGAVLFDVGPDVPVAALDALLETLFAQKTEILQDGVPTQTEYFHKVYLHVGFGLFAEIEKFEP